MRKTLDEVEEIVVDLDAESFTVSDMTDTRLDDCVGCFMCCHITGKWDYTKDERCEWPSYYWCNIKKRIIYCFLPCDDWESNLQ